ncbi:MAG: hypothetical protein ABW321_23365 [Polyangiales bacterium]
MNWTWKSLLLVTSVSAGCAGSLDPDVDYTAPAATAQRPNPNAGGGGTGPDAGEWEEPSAGSGGATAAAGGSGASGGAGGAGGAWTPAAGSGGTAEPPEAGSGGAGGTGGDAEPAAGSGGAAAPAAGSGGDAAPVAGAGGAAGGGAVASCDFRALMQAKCGNASCHGAPGTATGLDLTSPALAMRVAGRNGSGSCGDTLLVNADNPEQSVLYQRVTGSDCGVKMPLGGSLTADEQDCVLSWIEGL